MNTPFRPAVRRQRRPRRTPPPAEAVRIPRAQALLEEQLRRIRYLASAGASGGAAAPPAALLADIALLADEALGVVEAQRRKQQVTKREATQ